MKIIIGMIKGSIVIIVSILFLNRIWVLPESQRQKCIEAVHSWHIERIHKIDNLTVDGKIKGEMIKFSRTREKGQLEQICGVKNEKVVVSK